METPFFDARYKQRSAERIYREGIEQRDAGRKIFGVYCAFTPKEIIAAAGGIPVALCSGSAEPIQAAEAHLPRLLCPLVKATYGHALNRTCPYMEEVEYIFADATCDGKKKMFELLAEIKPLHLLSLPQENTSERSLAWWLEEMEQIKAIVERVTGNEVTEAGLRGQIALYNDLRAAVEEIYALNTGPVPLLMGREIEAVCEVAAGFECNLERRAAELRVVAEHIRGRAGDREFLDTMRRRPRILLTGCPTTNSKVLDIVEDAGGVVVAIENCGGLKTTARVEERGDPMHALAHKYLSTPCPCMTPNRPRMELIGRIARQYNVQGVVELTWEACHTYNVEAYSVNRYVTEELGLPYLQIRTDYSENDKAQILLRVQAFLEVL